ncbi:hypothetical protein DN069_11000 [Streptacidiphilus pinicola]|uniref:eCIS core domain-containing protein n=1 Tax=Streptacidiphilus pinicola TaxID=2219663 RepID=A0A2X0IQJ3_9ACTN|nr:DUF4157 domain-containing protein [Streptacidiphilus pinicola]RAG85461.1 hypothetical protein DN069_11000 [Streptacidiphilus pinicola]
MRVPAHDKAAAQARTDDPVRSLRGREPQQPSTAPRGVAELLALQRAAGNAAVTRTLASVQRSAAEQESEGRPVQRATAHQVLRSAGQPLQEPLRREMEFRLGADFSDVRIHTDPVAQRSAAEVGAHAYTSGHHVVLTDGGQDKHTLAHELTHVIQQRRGPVAGTDNGEGLSVSDPGDRFEREAETNATRVMAAHPPVQRAVSGQAHEAHEACEHAEGTTPVASGAPIAVQRKGFDEISGGLPAEPSAPTGGLFGKLQALTGNQARPDGPVAAKVRADIAAYDRDGNRDPMHCLMALSRIQHQLISAEGTAEGSSPFLAAAGRAVDAELALIRGQISRDDSFPEDARRPFRAMTDQGMLWNHPDWADSAAAFHMRGPSYFRELSELNRAGMAKEIARRGEQPWVADVRSRLTRALDNSVLCHYTPKSRAQVMLDHEQQIKSKTELLAADKDAPNNSEAYDRHGLANEGFVFFYLEVPNSPFRDSRFAGKDEPARVELPLTRSPLMSQGWLMLSDFAQREYPTLRTDPQDPGSLQSRLPTREEGFSDRFTRPVRRFDVGTGRAELDFDKVTSGMEQEPDRDRRGQMMFLASQAAADPHSAMTYGAAPGPQTAHPERLRSNTLMGSDIVPGLVERAIVEIQRIGEVDRHLADRLKAMSGNELLRFLLKDALRPQAMLPNTVSLAQARVVLSSGEELHPTPVPA